MMAFCFLCSCVLECCSWSGTTSRYRLTSLLFFRFRYFLFLMWQQRQLTVFIAVFLPNLAASEH